MTQVWDKDGKVIPVTLTALDEKKTIESGAMDIFSEGEIVTITGVSKGKGFQGVVKRHGFKGGSRTHGQKHTERAPGSIGGGVREGGKVQKGMRMAGRMGSDKITIKNLKIVRIDKAKKEIAISGAVPGNRGTVLIIKGEK